jgi:hypothetical protein
VLFISKSYTSIPQVFKLNSLDISIETCFYNYYGERRGQVFIHLSTLSFYVLGKIAQEKCFPVIITKILFGEDCGYEKDAMCPIIIVISEWPY